VGLGPELGAAQVTQAVSPGSLSALARAVLANVSREPRDYDELLAACGAEASGLGGALTELELAGLVLQRPGRRYESLG
jgi:predicted Rossmann fold nucleotide-binding protein DprA/Smf involved in DNA uptake